MTRTREPLIAAVATVLLLVATAPLGAQSTEPGDLKAGQRVEVEYVPGSGKWLAATVVEVVNDGFSYKVDIASGQGASESRTNIHFRRVRAAAPNRPATPAPTAPPVRAAPVAPAARPAAARPAMGRYGCSEFRYNASSGMYEYDAKGTVVLGADGRYTYLGFSRPSLGRHRAAAQAGKLTFAGGYLDGGVATPLDGQPGRFHLTAPAIVSRWTCGLTS